MIERDRLALKQLQVGRNDVAQCDVDDVAGHQLAGRQIDPFAVTPDPGSRRQTLLEQRDGVVRLVFLPERDAGIDQQHQKNDGEIRPVAGQARQQGGRFDHPRNRPPQVRQQLAQRAAVFFDNGVGTEFGQSLRCLRATKALLL